MNFQQCPPCQAQQYYDPNQMQQQFALQPAHQMVQPYPQNIVSKGVSVVGKGILMVILVWLLWIALWCAIIYGIYYVLSTAATNVYNSIRDTFCSIPLLGTLLC